MSRGFSCIGLYNPKNNLNVDSALRAAHSFGASAGGNLIL